MGGVGKTQVALEYAYRYEKTYDLIHFIDAHSVSTVEASYMSFLDMYTNTAVKNGINAAQQYKDHLRERRNWLLIFDNCDFYTNEDFAIFRDRLLPQSKGHIIITSRDLEEIDRKSVV